MIAAVLAAGRSRRLGALTDRVPKTLLPVVDDTPILELIFRNVREVDIDDVAIITGYRHEVMEEVAPALAARYGLGCELIYNPRYLEWNNCYSLWLARDRFAEDVLLVNGDTVHPGVVEQIVLKHRDDELLIAIDAEKRLGEEEMKVVIAEDGSLRRIHKSVDPAVAQGEYIGVTWIPSVVAAPLADALEATWQGDPSLYYEDGFQTFVDRGGTVRTVPIGTVEWVEVDDARDLERAREIACRY